MNRALLALVTAVLIACGDNADPADVQSSTTTDEAPTDPAIPVVPVHAVVVLGDDGTTRKADHRFGSATVSADQSLGAPSAARLPPREITNTTN